MAQTCDVRRGADVVNERVSANGPRRYYKALSSVSRINLLDALRRQGTLTIGELAAATGLHVNTTREHLSSLISSGLVSALPDLSGNRGRPLLRYRIDVGTDSRRERAPRGRPDQLTALSDHMAHAGFDATIDRTAQCMTMYDCPFARLSDANPQVCQVHLALIQHVLRNAASPLQAGALHRRSGPRECTLELTSSADRVDPAERDVHPAGGLRDASLLPE
jgi:predicted ArsR family transcriptional regulator